MMVNSTKNYCKFYLQGFCKNGTNCTFDHERPKCHFYSKGMCFRGNLCYFVHAEPEMTDATLLITSLEEIGDLPFKTPPPVSRETLSRDGLVRKLRGIQKRGGTIEQYYDRFNEVLENFYLYEITRDEMIATLHILCEDDELQNVFRYTLPFIFHYWCISCRHWADFLLELLTQKPKPEVEEGEIVEEEEDNEENEERAKKEVTQEELLDVIYLLDEDSTIIMAGTLVVGLLTLDKALLAHHILSQANHQDYTVYLKILAAYLQPPLIAMFLRSHIQQFTKRDDEFCRCTSFVCRCPTKVDPTKAADIVDTMQEVTSWSDFEKRDFIKVICHSLFKRPDIQEIADTLRFENDMVRAEAVCDTLAKPMSDIEKQHLRRVFHRAFGVHPRAINYHLSQEDPTARRQLILKLGIDPNEILSAAEVWKGPFKPPDMNETENKMELDALQSDKCQSPYIDCRNKPKDMCDRGLCRRCCLDYGRKNGTDCFGHTLFFTEGDFSDTEQDNSNTINKKRELGVIPKINFPFFRPRVTLYAEHNLDEAVRSKCRYQRVEFDPAFDVTDKHLQKLISRFSTELKSLMIGSKETKTGLHLTKESLKDLVKCRNLHKLSLECCTEMDDDIFIQIIENCTKLKHLEVSGCYKHNGKLTDRALEPLFSHTTQIQYLNLEFQRDITPEILCRLKRRRPALVTCDVYTNEKRTADTQMQHMIRQLTELTPSEGGEIISSSLSESSEDDANLSAVEKMSREADEVIRRFSPEVSFLGKGNIQKQGSRHLDNILEDECEEIWNQGLESYKEAATNETKETIAVLNGELG